MRPLAELPSSVNPPIQSWSFGILCYNERGAVRQVYDQVVQLILSWQLDQWEIILVDDGSIDGTIEIIKGIAATDERVRLILHEENRGIGAGIRSIYFNAGFENVVFLPGDGQFDVNELAPYKHMAPDTFVAFYRQENLTYSTFRNILSWINKLLNRLLFGIRLRDVNWVKVYKREQIVHLDLRLHSSAIESEICAKLILLGKKPIEIESRYLPRRYGTSKGASLASIFRVLRELGTLWYSVTVFRMRHKKQPS